MTDAEILAKRRELVELSADLQRATIARRIAALESRPARAIVGLLVGLLSHPGARRIALAAGALMLRAWRRRRAAHA